MIIAIRPYKMSSVSAARLKDKLKMLLNNKEMVVLSSKDHFNPNTFVINWGQVPQIIHKTQLNSYIGLALDKRRTFYELEKAKVPIPEWSQNKAMALSWVREGCTVYCRTLVAAKEGKGIVIAETPEEVVDAPLYTKRFPDGREYRVHIVNNNVIQIVQKKARNGHDANPLIRSNSAWVFARNIDPAPPAVSSAAASACLALGLDFGAVDVLWSVKNQQPCVLEVNTAPGLDNTSALLYAQAFIERMN